MYDDSFSRGKLARQPDRQSAASRFALETGGPLATIRRSALQMLTLPWTRRRSNIEKTVLQVDLQITADDRNNRQRFDIHGYTHQNLELVQRWIPAPTYTFKFLSVMSARIQLME